MARRDGEVGSLDFPHEHGIEPVVRLQTAVVSIVALEQKKRFFLRGTRVCTCLDES